MQPGKQNQAMCSHVSPRPDKTPQHHFAPSLVEIDGELVAVRGGDRAGAEFRVKHPRAFREGRTRARTRDQFSLDLHRTAARPALLRTPGTAPRWLTAALLRALPARRRIGRPIVVHIGKTRLRVAAIGRTRCRLDDFDMSFRQFVQETRRYRRLPKPMNAPVGREIYFRPALGPREADIGEAALFLQPRAA